MRFGTERERYRNRNNCTDSVDGAEYRMNRTKICMFYSTTSLEQVTLVTLPFKVLGRSFLECS